MNNILYHTLYTDNPWGHGGEKRTAQLAELCEECEVNRIVFNNEISKTNISILSVFKSIGIIFSVFRLSQFKSFIFFLKFWKNLTIQYPSLIYFFEQQEKLFVWESTKDIYYYLPYLAKKNKKKVIAVPHNLESLVSSQKSFLSGKISPFGFQAEIDVLKQCDAVFAISREETLMLKLFGVNAYYLPYYPTKEVECYLLSIREKRKNRIDNEKRQILLLGSAINPPTRLGMEDRIYFFEQNMIENIELRIAGYNTEQLSSIITNTKNISLLGELTVEKLEQELLQTDALLINQPATSGALTRIIEFLIAGIPVLVNEDSARSYFGMDGVWIYESNEQLIDFLQQDFLSMPTMPLKPKFQLNQFKNKLLEYSN